MEPEYLETEGGRLAYHTVQATQSATQQNSPGVIFCGGMFSDIYCFRSGCLPHLGLQAVHQTRILG